MAKQDTSPVRYIQIGDTKYQLAQKVFQTGTLANIIEQAWQDDAFFKMAGFGTTTDGYGDIFLMSEEIIYDSNSVAIGEHYSFISNGNLYHVEYNTTALMQLTVSQQTGVEYSGSSIDGNYVNKVALNPRRLVYVSSEGMGADINFDASGRLPYGSCWGWFDEEEGNVYILAPQGLFEVYIDFEGNTKTLREVYPVDTELSASSANPVENRVITTAINGLDSRVTTNEYDISANKTDISKRVKYSEVEDDFDVYSTLPIQNKVISRRVQTIEEDIENHLSVLNALRAYTIFYIYNDNGYLKVDYNTNQPNFSINANGELIYEGDLSLYRVANNIDLNF